MRELFVDTIYILGGIILLACMAWFVFMSNEVLEEKEKLEKEQNRKFFD